MLPYCSVNHWPGASRVTDGAKNLACVGRAQVGRLHTRLLSLFALVVG